MKYILFAILAVIVILLAVIIIRTLRFKPKAGPAVLCDEVEFDKDKAVKALQTLVKCKTISNQNHELENDGEFIKLLDSLPELYPNVFAVCEYTQFPDRGILIKWKGKNNGEPAVMMSHYDVVPVNEEGWEKPPFEGVIEDGVLWGRGTLDTKVTMNAALSAADNLIAQGFVPENDIYFAFSGGEEINGEGAVHIVDWFAEQGITPALVLDEGGAVVKDVFPGVTEQCGMIGIAEKGVINIEYRTKSNGGHASAPKPHTPVGILARACTRVENNPFKLHITKPIAEMFDTLGRHSNFVYRMVFANLWCFSFVLDILCKKQGGELNALMRTTVAFTQMEGSSAPNVIPPEAAMVSNVRLNSEDTIDSAIEYIKKTIDDDSVEVSVLHGFNASRISSTDCKGWDIVSSSVASTWKGTIVTPYLMMQASDSRHYGKISDKVYRFSAMDLTKEERGTIHGHNERIRIETIYKSVEFYIRVLKQC